MHSFDERTIRASAKKGWTSPLPRWLRVIRIDDSAKSPVPKTKYFRAEGEGVVTPPLELVTYDRGDETAIAINGLAAARSFWLAFNPTLTPDLVLADVDFEKDDTSPLHDWAHEKRSHIPTGLTHCKPFAAIARATGRPISIQLHTANAGQWRHMLSGLGAKDDRRSVFALLYASGEPRARS
jgi:hypothetical protein